MTIQTKKKLWRWGFFLLPLVTLFLPYVLFSVRGWNITADDMDITFIVLYGGYAFHTLLALSQLFLSLRILWFQKENRSQFSCQFHTIRFWVAFIFFVSIITIVWLFIFHDDSLNLVIQLSYIYFFSSFFYFIFCVLVNLVNLGHWISIKIPRKPKEEIAKEEFTPFQLEESKAQPSSRNYFWELTSLKKWIAVGLVATVLLGAGYLFGYDLNQPTATQSDIEKDVLSGKFSSLFYNEDMDTITQINNRYFEGIVHYQVFTTQEEQAKEEIRKAKENSFLPHLATYYNYEDKDLNAEAVISVCQYTPLVKKWGYGWFNGQGNLYANTFGKEQAKAVPNYRRNFFVTVRQGSIVWRFNIFTDEPNQSLALAETIHHCKTLQ